jgi:hypothetical protein
MNWSLFWYLVNNAPRILTDLLGLCLLLYIPFSLTKRVWHKEISILRALRWFVTGEILLQFAWFIALATVTDKLFPMPWSAFTITYTLFTDPVFWAWGTVSFFLLAIEWKVNPEFMRK